MKMMMIPCSLGQTTHRDEEEEEEDDDDDDNIRHARPGQLSARNHAHRARQH